MDRGGVSLLILITLELALFLSSVCLLGSTINAPKMPSERCVPTWAWYQCVPVVSGVNLSKEITYLLSRVTEQDLTKFCNLLSLTFDNVNYTDYM